MMSGQTVDPKSLGSAEKAMKSSLQIVETHFLADKDYITGSNPTIADISCFEEIKQLESVQVDLSQWPKISAWMQRMRQLPHYGTVHKFFDGVVARQKTAKL